MLHQTSRFLTKEYAGTVEVTSRVIDAISVVFSAYIIFRFFDIQNENFAKAQCSSLGGLMSKYALAGGLISIFEQFNASAGGFVNENFLGVIMGGGAIAPGKGGIEDIRVENTNPVLFG